MVFKSSHPLLNAHFDLAALLLSERSWGYSRTCWGEALCVHRCSPAYGLGRVSPIQDFGIQCPSTGTTFNLKTGEIMDWYPNNPVLRAITPQDTCRPMEVFPVKVTAEAICVDPGNSNLSGADYNNETSSSAGGADTSLENNNVFGIEPKVTALFQHHALLRFELLLQ